MIFDLGGVVLEWQPHRAYEQVLVPERVGDFLDRIDFAGWNRSHDAGRPFAEGEADLIDRFPEDEAAILAYRQHFVLTLTGMVPGTSAIIAELIGAGVRVVGLTNWSAETFPHAEQRFGILRRFEDILVSGTERLAKPDPAIFRLALDRFGLDAATTTFIDDSPPNVVAAGAVGISGLRFVDAETLRADLVDRGLLAQRVLVDQPVFHLAERSVWETAQRTGAYPWSSRDASYEAVGFVHCSFGDQLAGTIDLRYADLAPAERVVLELAPNPELVVEDLGAGAFPHLYAPLTPGLVTEIGSVG